MQQSSGINGASLVDPALRAMFEARKRVFVDLLGWDVPVLDGTFEIDQFDTPSAAYLVLTGENCEHRASARLLRSDGPHILRDLFPQLVERISDRLHPIRELEPEIWLGASHALEQIERTAQQGFDGSNRAVRAYHQHIEDLVPALVGRLNQQTP